MKGKILGFDLANGTGAISGDDDARYSFSTAELHGQAKEWSVVDFEVGGSKAKSIYIAQGQMAYLQHL